MKLNKRRKMDPNKKSDNIKIFPTLGLSSITRVLGGAWRLWTLARHLNPQGSGRINSEPDQEHSIIPFLVITPAPPLTSVYQSPKVPRVFIGLKNGKRGQPMTRFGVRDMIHKRGQALDLKLTTHDLRRTFATEALRKGASTRLVQIQGRWSDIRLVERYTQSLSPSDFDDHFLYRSSKP
jgi:integrase